MSVPNQFCRILSLVNIGGRRRLARASLPTNSTFGSGQQDHPTRRFITLITPSHLDDIAAVLALYSATAPLHRPSSRSPAHYPVPRRSGHLFSAFVVLSAPLSSHLLSDPNYHLDSRRRSPNAILLLAPSFHPSPRAPQLHLASRFGLSSPTSTGLDHPLFRSRHVVWSRDLRREARGQHGGP